MAYLFILISLVAIWQLWLRYRRSERLESLSDRSTIELRELKRLFTNRHLIISHLADSLPKSFDPNFGRKKLREMGQDAATSLSNIDPQNPSANKILEFTLREREFIQVTRKLVDCIATDSSVNRIHLVASCIEGLQKTNAQIGNCTSIYNTSAIAYRSLHEASLLKAHRPTDQFAIINIEDWTNDRSLAL